MTNSSKLFTIAGTALSPEGRQRFCVATGSLARRAYKLRYHGCSQVNLCELPEPMTAAAARAWFQAQQAAAEAAAAEAAAAKRAEFVARMAAARAAKRAARAAI